MSGAALAVFRIAYTRYSELRDDVTQQMVRGGLLVKIHDAADLTLDTPVQLEIVLPDRTLLQGTATVLQVFSELGVAVSVTADLLDRARRASSGVDAPDAGPAQHERLDPRTLRARGTRPSAAMRVDPARDPAREAPSPPARGTRPSSALPFDLARDSEPERGEPGSGLTSGPGSTRAEKIQQALHGTRDERNAILRDRDRTLHPFVLKNPQLHADDVVTIAKSAQAAPELLKQIAERKDWFQRPAIALALARNPRTPPELAVRSLEFVPIEAIRQMAKGVGALPHVVQAARKRLLG